MIEGWVLFDRYLKLWRRTSDGVFGHLRRNGKGQPDREPTPYKCEMCGADARHRLHGRKRAGSLIMRCDSCVEVKATGS